MLNYNDSNIDRLIDVIDGKIPDRVPYLDFMFSQKIIESVLGREIGYKITNRADHSTKIDIDSKDFIDFLYSIGQDLAGFLILAPDEYFLSDGHEIIKSIDLVENEKVFEKIQYPDFDVFLNQYKNRFESIIKYCGNFNIGATMLTGAFFQDTHQLVGFDNLMFKLYDDLDFVKKVLDFFAEIYTKVSEFICSYNVPVFFFTDNIAYNSGPFFDPALFKKLYLPRLKKVLKPARDKDIPILFDSDGDIEWIIDDLIELGVKAIHPIDPGAMDIYKIKEKYGKRVTIMGNVGQDFPLSTGSIEDVIADVKHRLKVLGKGGRYVIKSSHDVGENVRVENFKAMINTIHEVGYYQ